MKYFNRRNFRETNFREFREFWPFSRNFISRKFSKWQFAKVYPVKFFWNTNSRKFIQWNFDLGIISRQHVLFSKLKIAIRESLSRKIFSISPFAKVYLAKFLRFVKSRKFIQKNSRVFGLAKLSLAKVPPIKVGLCPKRPLWDAS